MVLDTFIRELQRSYRWRAKRELGLSSVSDAFTGMVTVIQRLSSFVFRLSSFVRVHVHVRDLLLVPDPERARARARETGDGRRRTLGMVAKARFRYRR